MSGSVHPTKQHTGYPGVPLNSFQQYIVEHLSQLFHKDHSSSRTSNTYQYVSSHIYTCYTDNTYLHSTTTCITHLNLTKNMFFNNLYVIQYSQGKGFKTVNENTYIVFCIHLTQVQTYLSLHFKQLNQ